MRGPPRPYLGDVAGAASPSGRRLVEHVVHLRGGGGRGDSDREGDREGGGGILST